MILFIKRITEICTDMLPVQRGDDGSIQFFFYREISTKKYPKLLKKTKSLTVIACLPFIS